MDFVGPLQETKKGNKYTSTCTDSFSKWSFAYALPNKHAETVVISMMNVITTSGIPKAILCDTDSEFNNMVLINRY